MVKFFLIFAFVFSCLVGAASCNTITPTSDEVKSGESPTSTQNETIDNAMNTKIKIKIGSKVFSAILADNPTATAFKALLPLTINMTELNGNEKYFRLSKNLPINPSIPSSIRTGDLLMYGSNTLVLFYESFSTPYSYTNVGRINDTTGLLAALGSGDIKITFELE